MTVEYAPWYWRKRKQQLAESRRQRRADPRPERTPVEYDLPTGKTRFGGTGSAVESAPER